MEFKTEKEKRDYLSSKGWSTLWNKDNWVHQGIMAGANLDYCGVDIESALRIQEKEENKNKPIKTYNKKGFLAPESIKSTSSYHAKIMEDGEYMFRIHDCIGGIRLLGNVIDLPDIKEAIQKLETLSSAANEFAKFIKENYLNN